LTAVRNAFELGKHGLLLVGAAVLGDIVVGAIERVAVLGIFVGAKVGAIDGAAVGAIEGASVGAIEGAAVLGLFVGAAVGAIEGAAVVHTDTAQNGPDGDGVVLYAHPELLKIPSFNVMKGSVFFHPHIS